MNPGPEKPKKMSAWLLSQARSLSKGGEKRWNWEVAIWAAKHSNCQCIEAVRDSHYSPAFMQMLFVLFRTIFGQLWYSPHPQMILFAGRQPTKRHPLTGRVTSSASGAHPSCPRRTFSYLGSLFFSIQPRRLLFLSSLHLLCTECPFPGFSSKLTDSLLILESSLCSYNTALFHLSLMLMSMFNFCTDHLMNQQLHYNLSLSVFQSPDLTR